MTTVFLTCAILGSTVIVLQFILTLIGFGHDDGGLGGGHDFDSGGHAAGHHSGHDTADSGPDQFDDHHNSHEQSLSNWLFGVLTFRAIMTFVAFFGLAGMAALSAEWTMIQAVLVAIAAGVGAVAAMNEIFRRIYRLRADGTARIDQSVGLPGTVYLRIPGEGSGWGKIQMMLQNRTMEFEASTPAQPLPTGTQIVVTRVVGPDRVEVLAAN